MSTNCTLLGSELTNDLEEFKAKADAIVANRRSDEFADAFPLRDRTAALYK